MNNARKYGHRLPDITRKALGLGWISGVKRIEFSSAKTSYWHRHAETTMLGCLKGEVSYEFHGIPPITLSAGSFLVIPAHAEHRHLGEIDPVNQRIELLLDVIPRKQAKYSLFTANTARTLHRKLLQNALSPVKLSKDTFAAAAELYDLAGKTRTGLSESDLGYARLLVTRILYGTVMPHETHAERSPVMMDSILKWIESHLNETIDISRIADKMGFSRTHVFTLFKKRTGLTPADYIIRIRIKRACEALRDPAATSKAVAKACGFTSPSLFNAIFKRQTGLTPSQWRRKQAS